MIILHIKVSLTNKFKKNIMKRIFTLFSLLLLTQVSKAQFCTPVFSSYCCTSQDFIDDFFTTGATANITNMSSGGCTTPQTTSPYSNYTYFSGFMAAATPGSTFDVHIRAGSTFGQGFRVWIDWNNSGTFDPTESVFSCASGTTTQVGTISVPAGAVGGVLRMRVMCRYAGTPLATDYCATTGMTFGECEDYNINILTQPCSGKPEAGAIASASTVTLCPSATYTMIDTGYTTGVTNINFLWQKSTNGGATWTTITGTGNQPYYTIPAGTASACYRMLSLCTLSFQFDTSSNMVCVALTPPSYALLPYTQNFESWVNSCSNLDVPDDHWGNNPSTGNNSWRKNSEGSTANWVYATSGPYAPGASLGNFSARFHCYQGVGPGNLDLYVDMGSAPGNKMVMFDDLIPSFSGEIRVEFSTNGGTSFTPLDTLFDSFGLWRTDTLTITSNAPNCVLRFKATNPFTFNNDMGLDNLSVLPMCTGAPSAGIIHDTMVCAGFDFLLSVDGATQAGGLSYIWESAPTSTGPWTNIGTTIVPQIVTNTSNPTYYQCTVVCNGSSLSATTPVKFIDLNVFYYCYCNSAIPNSAFDYFDIGNVFVRKATTVPTDTIIFNAPIAAGDTFNNAGATLGYTNYQHFATIPKIYLDSTYQTSIVNLSQYTYAFGSSRVFIDYDRDGNFNTSNESVVANGISNGTPITTGAFTVPHNATLGITGLRVISNSNSPAGTILPCNSYFNGETEDYLVEIIQAPCKGPLNPGSIYISDNQICPGYDVVLIDTTHTSVSYYAGLSYQWQKSPNGTTGWTNIAGATSDTFIAIVNSNTYFRFKILCANGDSAYSAPVSVTMFPLSTCYPASGAQWGATDTCDNGAFGVGNFLFTAGGGGPHIGNPLAVKSHSTFTTVPISLYADSTYNLSFYTILKPYAHADARVTMFIDYNNNNLFDIPSERVFTGTANAANFYLNGSFKTIVNPSFGLPTGLRVVVNNNAAPNPQSDNGVGIYLSGETEDYVVQFAKKAPLGINTIADMQNIDIYPNPTSGIVFINAEFANKCNLNVVVTSITGQEVYRNVFNNVVGKFESSINLDKLARGTYTIKMQTEKGNAVRVITVE
jgi:hypothetical protein